MIKIQITLTRKKQLPAGAKQCSTKTASANSRLSKRTHAPSPNSKTNQKPQSAPPGTRRGGRTLTPLQESDFESDASADSAIRARIEHFYVGGGWRRRASFFRKKDDKVHAIEMRLRIKPHPFPRRPSYASAFTSFINGSRLEYARTLSNVVCAMFINASFVKNA